MTLPNIAYQRFCWVLGTTSFRTAQLNLKIEQQLIMLDELHEGRACWDWRALQVDYYDLMQSRGFVKGDANRKDKDAREKTSGLVDIGLLTADRKLTEVGHKLKNIAEQESFKSNNFFELEADSYLYFKQLLKAHLIIDNNIVRPYIVLVKLLSCFNYLSYDEFKYFLPLCISDKATQTIIKKIPQFRENKIDVIDVIYETLSQLESFRVAYNLLLSNEISEELICVIGINRKSRSYDKPYYELFLRLVDVFVDKNYDAVLGLYKAAKATKQGGKWVDLLFKNGNQKNVKKLGAEYLDPKNPFLLCGNVDDLKRVFFKYLHVFKAMATLEDYFDLNRRYFSLTNTIIFDEQKVKFDILPKYFFDVVVDGLYDVAYQINLNLNNDIELNEIHLSLIINKDEIYKKISKDYNMKIVSSKEVNSLLSYERYNRFSKLLDENFTKDNLLKLLDYFETRDDKNIHSLVTDEADIPTIFEYVLGVIWYEISERQGDILNFMNLSLGADLLPKTHASGGSADIVYKYEKTSYYPKHDLLIEATLATDSNQRRMELEPVSRHLGEHLLKYQQLNDYAIFISTFLHRNVIADFRSRKIMPYYGKDDMCVDGMKIIPLDTTWLKTVLKQDKKYRDLYPFFDKLHHQDIKPHNWQEAMNAKQKPPF